MAHPVDIHVGGRVRLRRCVRGMTQVELADRVGIKFQQIQKYESGVNRVSASRMWDIAAAMDVPMSYFFEGLDGKEADAFYDHGDILSEKETMELIRTYYGIPEHQRRRLLDLARVLSEAA